MMTLVRALVWLVTRAPGILAPPPEPLPPPAPWEAIPPWDLRPRQRRSRPWWR